MHANASINIHITSYSLLTFSQSAMEFFSLKLHKFILSMVVFSFVVISSSRAIVCVDPKHKKSAEIKEKNEDNPINHEGDVGGKPEEYYPAGSSLPDCSHACGPCFPCKRVLVSFKCSASESCPIVYRCMCKGKFYHIPSAH